MYRSPPSCWFWITSWNLCGYHSIVHQSLLLITSILRNCSFKQNLLTTKLVLLQADSLITPKIVVPCSPITPILLHALLSHQKVLSCLSMPHIIFKAFWHAAKPRKRMVDLTQPGSGFWCSCKGCRSQKIENRRLTSKWINAEWNNFKWALNQMLNWVCW